MWSSRVVTGSSRSRWAPPVPCDCQYRKQITLSFSCRTLTPYQLEQSKYLQHGPTINCHTENYDTPIKNEVFTVLRLVMILLELIKYQHLNELSQDQI